MSTPRPLLYSLNQIPFHQKHLKRDKDILGVQEKTKKLITKTYSWNSHLEQPKTILVITSTVTPPLLPHQETGLHRASGK